MRRQALGLLFALLLVVPLSAGTPTIGTPSPDGLHAAANGVTSCPLGAYSYDGSGNIVAIGTNTYRYDAAGRLVSATVEGPGN